MEKVTFSIDIGTTNLKINLFDHQDKLIDATTMPLTQTHITDVYFEVDLEEIWQHVKSGLENLRDKHQVQSGSIILTTAMHSIQLLEENGMLAFRTITWADKRGRHALADMKQEEKTSRYLRTGTPNHTMNPYYKLKEISGQITDSARIGSIKDVLFERLTGEWAIDVSNTSASGLYNIEDLSWDTETLQSLGFSEGQLPTIRPIDYSVELADGILDGDFRVIIGTSDGVSSNLTFKELKDVAVLSVGTSHAVRVVSSGPELNAELMNFSYVIDENRYLTGLASNNGASVLHWLSEIMRADFEELEEIARTRPETTAVFLPFLMGERAPLWDEQASASLINLTRSLSRESLIYAVILGMCFNIKQNVTALEQLVGFEAIGLVGGITQIPAVVQLLADILGKSLYIPNVENAETLGSIQAVRPLKIELEYTIVEPSDDLALPDYENQYQKAYERYLNQ